MAKKSSLFKTLSTIIVLTALTLSVATGAVIGRAIKNFTDAQQQGKETLYFNGFDQPDGFASIVGVFGCLSTGMFGFFGRYYVVIVSPI